MLLILSPTAPVSRKTMGMPRPLSIRLIVSIGNEHFVAMLYRHALKAFHQFGEEWILNVGDDQAIDMALACAQSACMGVGVITTSLDHRPDTLFGARVYWRRAVHHT